MEAPRKPSRDARRAGRVAAMQILYGLDTQAVWTTEPHAVENQPELGREAQELAETLVKGVVEGREEIDQLLQRAASNWRLERMNRVDRNVLRVAIFELLHASDVPAPVVLDEAIEIAKQFGSAASGSFVNGVLDRVLRDLGRQQ